MRYPFLIYAYKVMDRFFLCNSAFAFTCKFVLNLVINAFKKIFIITEMEANE